MVQDSHHQGFGGILGEGLVISQPRPHGPTPKAWMSWWIADHLMVMAQENLGEPVGHQSTPPNIWSQSSLSLDRMDDLGKLTMIILLTERSEWVTGWVKLTR